MQAFAPGGPEGGLQPRLPQTVADQTGRRLHLNPGHSRPGIEIEDHAVAEVRIIGARTPGMELDDVHLHQGHDVGGILDHEVIRPAP